MIPEIDFGPVTIYTFGLMSVLGGILGGAIGARWYRQLGFPGEWAWEMTIMLMLLGVVGGTIFYVVQSGESLASVPSLILSGQGMVWYGSIGLGIIGATIWTYWRRMPFWDMFSGIIFGFVAIQMLGRIGCQLAGDGDYGIPWDGPWAMGYPNGIVPTPPGVTVHPTPIYEALGLAALLIVLWKIRWKVSQPAFCGIWLIGSALIRFPVEFVRRNPDVFLSLTVAQWISLVLFALGCILLAIYYKKPPPEPVSKREKKPALYFLPWEKSEREFYKKQLTA